MDIIVGSYEKIILGYKLCHSDDKYFLELKFTNNDHSGAVKAVAISQKGILASGSSDETIQLFNLKKNVELGSLVSHTGTITWLEFIQGGHLLSASADNSFALWRHFTWQPLHVFQGHKGAVNCVAVHPTSKLALSVSTDKTVRTWDLTNNHCAYITSIKEVGEIVQWSPDGSHYIIVCNDKIYVYTIKDCALQTTIKSTKRVNCVTFLDERTLAYGEEGGKVYFFNLVSRRTIQHLDTGTPRVRGLVYRDNLLVCASTNGQIKVYKLTVLENSVTAELLVAHDTQCRLLCLAVSPQKSSSTGTQQKETSLYKSGVHENDEEDESEEGDDGEDEEEEVIDSDDDDGEEDEEESEEEDSEDSGEDGPSLAQENGHQRAHPHKRKQSLPKGESRKQVVQQGNKRKQVVQQGNKRKQTMQQSETGKQKAQRGKKRKRTTLQSETEQQRAQQGKKRRRSASEERQQGRKKKNKQPKEAASSSGTPGLPQPRAGHGGKQKKTKMSKVSRQAKKSF